MITLYEHPLSPYAQKVKIALREKGVPFAGSTDVTPPPAMIREWLILGPRGSGKRALTRTCFCRCCTLSASCRARLSDATCNPAFLPRRSGPGFEGEGAPARVTSAAQSAAQKQLPAGRKTASVSSASQGARHTSPRGKHGGKHGKHGGDAHKGTPRGNTKIDWRYWTRDRRAPR